MSVLGSGAFDRWVRGTAVAALVPLAWAAFLADDTFFWAAVVAVGLIGSAVATSILVQSRGIPTLAEVITKAEAEPPRGEREP